MHNNQIFIKSGHNHEPGSVTRRSRQFKSEPYQELGNAMYRAGQFIIAKQEPNVKEEHTTQIFEIIQI